MDVMERLDLGIRRPETEITAVRGAARTHIYLFSKAPPPQAIRIINMV